MAKWQPRTPKQTLQASLDKLKVRIQKKTKELKTMEEDARQVEQAIKALG